MARQHKADKKTERKYPLPVLPHATALDIADSVEYISDSIVSKYIAESEWGSIAIFALDEGQRLSEHFTPYDGHAFVLEGEAEFIFSGKTVHVGPGQLVIMPANVPHEIRAPERFKMLLVMIRESED